MKDLNQIGLVTIVTIGRWSPWKRDKQIAIEIAQDKKADPRRIHSTKQLIAKEALQKLNKLLNSTYTKHVKWTLPTATEGQRLVVTRLFDDHREMLQTARAKLLELMNEFLEVYPAYCESARAELGDAWNQADYPTPDRLKQRFYINYKYLPLPPTEPIIDLSQSALTQIRKNVEEEYAAIHRQAQTDLWNRVLDVAERMVERLNAIGVRKKNDGKAADAIFRDSLVANIAELGVLLEPLNYTNDPVLSEVAAQMRLRLGKYDPEQLRSNRVIRLQAAQEATQVVETARHQLRLIRHDIANEEVMAGRDAITVALAERKITRDI